jgi:uncharacterized protein (TIGR03435 family)
MTVRGLLQFLVAAVASVTLFAQTAPRLEFEVASIKPSASGGISQVRAGLHIDGSLVSCARFSINDYIGIAYKVRSYQISGPDWTASERFDINAKLPAGSQGKEIPEMLQTLLEDRFKMKFHRENKDFPVYGLVIGKGGLKMKESVPDPPVDPQDTKPRGGVNVAVSGEARGVNVDYGNGSSFSVGNNKFEGKKLPAPLIADVLARFTDRPVVNMTDLKGNYDFSLELTPEDFRAMMIRAAISSGITLPPQALQLLDTASGDSLLNAVEKLGLKLESLKAPIEVLVIDHIEKTPTDN